MKKLTIHSLTTIAATVLGIASAQAWDFSYGYKNVFDPNADQYIVGQQTVRKYSEWQNPPTTYWGPSANDTATTLTMQFSFAAPTTEIALTAQLVSANNGFGAYGSASLWGSTDGSTWQLLLNSPTPGSGVVAQTYYNQDVPASLLGSTSFWLQARMQETGGLTDASDPAADWSQAQFSRLDPGNGGNIFQLNVLEVPEPATWQLGLGALLALWGLRSRR